MNDAFWTKVALLAPVLRLEVWPALTFTRWRAALRRRGAVGVGAGAPWLARISDLQAGLMLAMAIAATAMARGLGARG